MKAYNYQGLDKLQNDVMSTVNRLNNKGINVTNFVFMMSPFKYKQFSKDTEGSYELISNPNNLQEEGYKIDYKEGVINGFKIRVISMRQSKIK